MSNSDFSAFTNTREQDVPEAPIVNAEIPVLTQQGYAETYEGTGEMGHRKPTPP